MRVTIGKKKKLILSHTEVTVFNKLITLEKKNPDE